ncbi:MAG: hypothetical protein ACRD0J_16880, partial [Acidimicrobiales bacterium]
LAFPDEDVLVGTRLIDPDGFIALAGLEDIVPRPGHRATGEERAWGRRLAKRFGADGRIDDRSFVLSGEGSVSGALDYGAPGLLDGSGGFDGSDGSGAAGGRGGGVDGSGGVDGADVAGFFGAVDPGRGDGLVVFGWAMAEDLAAGQLGSI